MGRTGNKYLLLLAVLVFAQFVDANSLVRRRRADDGKGNWIERMRDWLRDNLPLFGGPAATSIQYCLDGWAKTQDMTNGAVGRALGGMFPCTLSKEAFVCTGVTMDSDAANLVMWFIRPMPGFIVPQIIKDFINAITQLSIPVALDTVFGGVKTNPS